MTEMKTAGERRVEYDLRHIPAIQPGIYFVREGIDLGGAHGT